MSTKRMPAVFVGHGNPMNAVTSNAYTEAWADRPGAAAADRHPLRLGALVPAGYGGTAMRGRAPSTTSAGFRPSCSTCSTRRPATRAGARVAHLLGPRGALDRTGVSTTAPGRCWCRCTRTPTSRWCSSASTRRARALALRARAQAGAAARRGRADPRQRQHRAQPARLRLGPAPLEPYDWGLRFEAMARELMIAPRVHDAGRLRAAGPGRDLSAPTPEHFLPLLYVLAQHTAAEAVSFPVHGFDGGSVSMLAVQLG